ncbi:MAG: type II toxin-antitoxin system RelE/ParE family toxin [Spirochaetaceae bacterium]|nr:type II toxin-antitoxin system RelE/ParE family toxin [Spirochaetaceae bacterium]
MASYKLIWKNSAKKEVRKLEKKERLAILCAVEELCQNPHEKQGIKKLVGSDLSYRLRVGNYRIVYELMDNILTIEIIKVKHRKDVYRN